MVLMTPGSGPAPSRYARIRPSDGNPLIAPRPPRPPTDSSPFITRRPPRPTTTRTALISNSQLSSLRASQWAVPSASAIAAQREREANSTNTADWNSFKLTTTKGSILKALRHHVIRLHPKRYEEVPDPNNPAETVSAPRKVNLLDPTEFARPVRLHRRDPCAPLGGVKEAEAARLLAAQQTVVHDEEQEARDAELAQKAANKAEVASKIAPGVAKKKKSRFVKKTEQVFHHDQVNAQMRYEESQPWFIEDFDNGNTWQGQREQSLSGGAFVALVYNKNNRGFNMIPIEKWYKFREVNKFKMAPKEAAERKRQLDGGTPMWLKTEKVVEVDEPLTAEETRLYEKNARSMVKGVVTSKGSEEARATTELEEMDYDHEFDNDDAGQVYGGGGNDSEEEQREIEKRVKKEQLTANSGLRTGSVHEEDNSVKEIAAAARTQGRKTRQFLRKREGNNNYDSDSDSNPYASSHEDEDEDGIAARAEAVKKEVEARLKTDGDKKADEVTRESKKAVDAAEKRAKAAEKRRETAKKKKVEKALEAGEPSSAIPEGLTALGKKGKGKPAVTTVTPARATEGSPLGRNKRTAEQIAGFDSSSDSNSTRKKPKKNVKASHSADAPTNMGPPDAKKTANKRKPETAPGEQDSKKPRGNAKASYNAEVLANATPMGPPAAKKVANKRKSETVLGEQDNKKPRIDHASHSPPPGVARPASSAPRLGPVTDGELKAVLRSHPNGITMKGITEAFKGRMTKSKEDIKAMVASMKRVGKIGPVKGKYVLKDGLVRVDGG